MQRRRRSVAVDAVSRRPIFSAVVAGTMLAAAVLLWLGFAPSSVGGDFSYVLVQGDSMAPAVDHGDVVLLRQRDDYDPGEIVAYHHPDLGVVFHRITVDRGARFVVQGDNRRSADAYQPTADDIIGAGIRTLPRVGLAARELQSPRNLALLLTGAIGLGVAAPRTAVRVDRGAAGQRERPGPNRSASGSGFRRPPRSVRRSHARPSPVVPARAHPLDAHPAPSRSSARSSRPRAAAAGREGRAGSISVASASTAPGVVSSWPG